MSEKLLTAEGLDAVLSSTRDHQYDESEMPQDRASLVKAFDDSVIFQEFRKAFLLKLIMMGSRGIDIKELRNAFDSMLRVSVITGIQWERARASLNELEKMVQ